VAEAIQTGITAYWNQRGASYDQQPGHASHGGQEHRAWLSALADLLPPAPADILDVGAGTGFLSFLLAELGRRVIGADLADGMPAQARAKATGLANRRSSRSATPSSRRCRPPRSTPSRAAICSGR
jgi:ubiquinone/menaquinone biosynthesis C-methylase UbiE